MRREWLLVLIVSGVVVAACTSTPATTTLDTLPPTTTVPSTTSTTSLDPTPTLPPVVAEDRWIEVDGRGFTDMRTGDAFVPRGVNLLLKVGGGGGDRMFALYDPVWVDEQLDGIVAHGFNTVRFFLDMCMTCTTSDSGIRPGFLDNLSDLLTRMEAHGIVALPTSNDVPDPGFSNRLPCCEPFGGYRNSLYLTSEGHQIAAEYWTELIEGLKERGTPTHHILGWQLANEQFFLRSVPPISLTEGEVTTADGVTYDLSSDEEVADMVVSNLRAFITTVGDAIRHADDDALVTMGFFSSEEPDAGRVAHDDRWVVPAQIVADSTLDFVDLHAYPGLGGTWEAIGPAYGLDEITPDVPLLLGEYGAFELAYPDPQEAAAAMARWQAESCDLGFVGWLLWFWGANKDDEVITVESHDAVIAQAASPLVRPDPCDVGPYVDL
ncbi:MAG: hypothetical protein KDB69_03685, partial [Acidimicrobiia bacterium]|nr:hypothetical protein [Acidimicrobiia bacterium]